MDVVPPAEMHYDVSGAASVSVDAGPHGSDTSDEALDAHAPRRGVLTAVAPSKGVRGGSGKISDEGRALATFGNDSRPDANAILEGLVAEAGSATRDVLPARSSVKVESGGGAVFLKVVDWSSAFLKARGGAVASKLAAAVAELDGAER